MTKISSKNKLIFFLSTLVLISCLFCITCFADDGFAPSDIYLTGIGEYRGVGDYTTYAIVNGSTWTDDNGNLAYEISAFNFNQTFFDRYVEGYTSIDSVMTTYFSQNQSFSVYYYYYDDSDYLIHENYFDYDSSSPPWVEFWDTYVSTFRTSLEIQFGGYFSTLAEIQRLSSRVDSLSSDLQAAIDNTGRLNSQIAILESNISNYVSRIDSLNNQIDDLTAALPLKYQEGYTTGFNEGVTSVDVFKEGVNTIFSAPSYALYSIFNFEIFGINVLSVILMIISLCVIAWLIRKFI